MTKEDLSFICELECRQDMWSFEEFVETDPDAVRKKYTERIESDYSFDFIVTLADEAGIKPVGLVQIWSYVSHRRSWELGFAILPEYQGHGYGYEAVERMLGFAFGKLQAHKVVGMCNSRNQKSFHLMEKLGMRREGTFKQEIMWNGEWHDQYFYSMLRSEYQQTFGDVHK